MLIVKFDYEVISKMGTWSCCILGESSEDALELLTSIVGPVRVNQISMLGTLDAITENVKDYIFKETMNIEKIKETTKNDKKRVKLKARPKKAATRKKKVSRKKEVKVEEEVDEGMPLKRIGE